MRNPGPSSFASFAVFVMLAGAMSAQGPVLDYPALLARLSDADWLWQPPLGGERCVQFSSYDRASQRGPADVAAWYANGDRGHHLRVEEQGGGKQFVMVDASGPGCIARIWSANPQGTLHFDIDGARAWSVDFAALCSGKVDGVPEPLAGLRSKGGNCHLPIPFAKSLVVSCTAGDCYYAFDVVQWPAGTTVPGFGAELLAANAQRVRELCAAFPAAVPRWRSSTGLRSQRRTIPRGHVVRSVRVDLPEGLTPEQRRRVTEASILVVRCAGEETVCVPLAHFFVCAQDGVGHVSRFLGVTRDSLFCAFPMPMPEGGSIRLESPGLGEDLAPWFGLVHSEPLPTHAPEPLLFRANYHLAKGTPTRPFSDHLVLDAKGQGRFVGCSLLVRNPSRLWWGEGDEKVTVDGEAFPSWFGTGTEDYFGYAWCDPTPFQSPLHAQIECQGPQNYGFTQLHRTHLLDAVPFQRSLRFELERWHWVEDITIDYATVAYWYGAPGATSGLPPLPIAAERELPKLGPPPVFVAEGVLEGEDLRVLACPSGAHEKQDTWFLANMFSRDGQRWWRDGKPGDTLVLALPVASAGRYRVSAAFCRSEEHGIVQVSLAGKALGAPFDGYANTVRSSGPLELGVVELPAGEAELRLALLGRHEQAKPRFMIGLDYVKLERLP